uniref:Thioredoxin domain-containing protein n=1 Tax=Rhodosorus marinus TaxID=101924 RepID=A0A7S0BTB5_9RHOD|mmetsp:Transcript_8120/g.12044  ORF Transcript_8120/g.12044 Transcript_8120/m.12044 type:complete len:165 (+) Transcript_8120:105-599(+)
MAFVVGSGLGVGIGAVSHRGTKCSRRPTVSMVATAPAADKVGRDSSGNVKEMKTTQEYSSVVNDHDDVVLVKFYAPWCRACEKTGRLLEGVAPQYPEVSFNKINFSTNRELCRSLGIKAMPTFHVYYKGEKIDDFSCGPKRFPQLVDRLESFKNGFCKIEEDDA